MGVSEAEFKRSDSKKNHKKQKQNPKSNFQPNLSAEQMQMQGDALIPFVSKTQEL